MSKNESENEVLALARRAVERKTAERCAAIVEKYPASGHGQWERERMIARAIRKEFHLDAE